MIDFTVSIDFSSEILASLLEKWDLYSIVQVDLGGDMVQTTAVIVDKIT